ncbi:hypothetical protein M422DRAFT_252472 [Sphaerobolus stellatus SS14]|uniref:Cytokinin riboside 5'-monophosphate phosphoribohydrolase n=1 Tax=Sphaerobolus stellatus (strain SS14) TaxID=990650 RepID=A0A0C9ULS8_SPHS4|nr:hypothetical protein M422DRAFT_252472 [Sphaerobolus stellatus SS14]
MQLETVVVHSMHDRKLEMAKRAEAFVGLPGGFGTFEELMEVITWSQIGIHHKPIIFLNVLGFYNPIKELVYSCIRGGLIDELHQELIIFIDGSDDPNFDWGTVALEAMGQWKKPYLPQKFNWMKTLDDPGELEETKPVEDIEPPNRRLIRIMESKGDRESEKESTMEQVITVFA